jgi:hypothetical protein
LLKVSEIYTATSRLAIISAMPFEDSCSSNSDHSIFSPRTPAEIILGCRISAVPGHALKVMVSRGGSNERRWMRGRREVKQRNQP